MLIIFMSMRIFAIDLVRKLSRNSIQLSKEKERRQFLLDKLLLAT